MVGFKASFGASIKKQKNHSFFFFSLSLFRRDEDYVEVYLKKQKNCTVILTQIHIKNNSFFLVFMESAMCLVQIKKSINLQVLSSMLEL